MTKTEIYAGSAMKVVTELIVNVEDKSALSRLLVGSVLLALFCIQVGCKGDASMSFPDQSDLVSTEYEFNESNFEGLFASQRSVVLKPRSSDTFMSVKSVRQVDSTWAVIDENLPGVRIFDDTGAELHSFGESGAGPVEFSSPDWLHVLSDSVLIVREGGPNFRFQTVTMNGKHIQFIPTGTFNPATESYLSRSRGELLTTTRAMCSNANSNAFCTIVRQDLEDGSVLDAFLLEEEIEPGFKGLPFISAWNESNGQLWVAHRRGKYLVRVNDSGQILERLDMRNIPGMDPMDMSELPRDMSARAAASSEQTRTFIRRMHRVADHLMIEYGWMGPGRNDYPLNNIVLIDTSTHTIHHGMTVSGTVVDVNGFEVTFVTDVSDSKVELETHKLRNF